MTVTEPDIPTFPVEIMGPDEYGKPLSIAAAMERVMNDVQAVRKGGMYDDNRGTKYPFRGIDDVVNAVGPVLRKHGVRVQTRLIKRELRDTKTAAGRDTREVLVEVEYTLKAPDGSCDVHVVPGESLDTSDKGTAKAMSVAYRILWLQALCIPTDDPDPDASHLERTGTGPMPAPLVVHIQRGVRAPAAFQPGQDRWYLAMTELQHLWRLVQAYSAAELEVPNQQTSNPRVTWHELFAERYAQEIARMTTIEQCSTLWTALGEPGLAGFRYERLAVGDHLKARGSFLQTRCADELAAIARATGEAKTAAEVHEVRRTLMLVDSQGHVFGPGLEAAYAALEARERGLNERMVKLYGTPGYSYGDPGTLAEAYRNALEQLTDPGLVATFRADVEGNIELADNQQEELLAALDKRAAWLQAELDGPSPAELSDTTEVTEEEKYG
jgi:hypothetical protein